jgi:hypothetical protein
MPVTIDRPLPLTPAGTGVRGSGSGGHPGLALGEHDQGVEEADAVLGGGGEVAANGAELPGAGAGPQAAVPPLARWCLAAGVLATIGANLAHGLGHGPIGALVSAWPALALAGSFELLMTLIRTEPHSTQTTIPRITRARKYR